MAWDESDVLVQRTNVSAFKLDTCRARATRKPSNASFGDTSAKRTGPMTLRNRSVQALLAATLALAMSACGTSAGDDAASGDNFKTRLQMGTGSPGGVYFPLGTQYANLLSDKINVQELQITAIETGASVENIAKINKGDIQLGLAQSNTANSAINSQGEFKDASIDNLGFIGSLYPEALHVITLESSDVESIEDLKGKKVAIGPPGSGSQEASRSLLAAYGIEEGEYTALQEGFDDAKRKLQNGNVDVVIEVMGVPYGGLQQIEAAREIKLLPIGDDALKTLQDETDSEPYEITKEAYDFIEEPVQTVSVFATMLASPTQVSEDLGYEITKGIYEYADELTLPQQTVINTKNALLGRGDVPLHPGAKKYFDEIGVSD